MRSFQRILRDAGRNDYYEAGKKAANWGGGHVISLDGVDPTVFFHGTPNYSFDTFSKRFAGSNTNNDDAKDFLAWLSSREDVARDYADYPGKATSQRAVLPMFVKTRNPFEVDFDGGRYSEPAFKKNDPTGAERRT